MPHDGAAVRYSLSDGSPSFPTWPPVLHSDVALLPLTFAASCRAPSMGIVPKFGKPCDTNCVWCCSAPACITPQRDLLQALLRMRRRSWGRAASEPLLAMTTGT